MPRYTKNKCTEYVQQLAQPGEIFVEVTTDMVSGIYDYYQVSNFGRVYHNYLKIIMKPGLGTSGYHFFIFVTKYGKKIVQLHRLVLIAFNNIPNIEDYDVNHKNGDKLCNYLWNLEWSTRSQNVKHAYENGLHPRGEDLEFASVSNETARDICKYLEQGYDNEAIAYICNTTIGTVQSIRSGKGYSFISKDYNFKRRTGRKFTEEQIRNICEYFVKNPKDNNMDVNAYCKKALEYYSYDSSPSTIDCLRKVYTRKYYTNISKEYNF